MGIKRTVRLFYLFYTIYTIFIMLVSDYEFSYAFWGLTILWSVYFAFSVGYHSSKWLSIQEETIEKKEPFPFPFAQIADWKTGYYLLCGIACWICVILAGRFYTSRGLIQVISGLFTGERAYSIYQSYARIVNQSFSIRKVPYILMLTYSTVVLFWGSAGIILSGKKIKISQYVFLVLVYTAYIYFGIARGTNFEVYIAFIVLVYCILNRQFGGARRLNKQALIWVGILGIGVIIIFRLVVGARGITFRNNICTEIRYDPERFVSKYFPIVTNMMTSIFRYLGWGIYTFGAFFNDVISDSFKGFFASLLPLGYPLIFNADLPTIIRDTVDVGVGWVPDHMTFINYFGMFGYALILFVTGRLAAQITYSHNIPNILSGLIGLIIFIEMLSIPVGNFLITSTPNTLTALIIVFWYYYERLMRRREQRTI